MNLICPYCKRGKLFRDQDDDLVCIACARRYYKDKPLPRINNLDRRKAAVPLEAIGYNSV